MQWDTTITLKQHWRPEGSCKVLRHRITLDKNIGFADGITKPHISGNLNLNRGENM
jgi:hypothetical protein